jgi:ADP-ribose pyrophosphatase YjhB (NUDIX family)
MPDIFEYAKQIQALAETGLQYSSNEYDIERYHEITAASIKIIELLSDEPYEKIKLHIEDNDGYKTPKIDIRAAIFDEHHNILLVQEKKDNHWSLPGGFADVGYTPSQIAVKETREEAGIDVAVHKLVAVLNKRSHGHPKGIYDAYKLFFLCHKTGGTLAPGMETNDARYFSQHNIPLLSTPRNTEEQIHLMFDYHSQRRTEVLWD